MPQVDITTFLPLILWILFLILVFLKFLVSNGTLYFLNTTKLDTINTIITSYYIYNFSKKL